MATSIIRPSDLTPELVARVLDFLNRVPTAEALSAAIEIPNEVDIGIALSRRILARRAQLGGSFSRIEQVAEVPLIGPQRFSELVIGITRAEPEPVELTLESLQDELRALRASLFAAAATRTADLQVTVREVVPRAYLGQQVTLIAEVSASGLPVIDANVTLVTTWGALRASDGRGQQLGPSVTLRSDLDGIVRAVLQPAPAEALRLEQEIALESALHALPDVASTPRSAQPALVALSAQYRRTESVALRAAIDAYAESFGMHAEPPRNATDPLAVWPLVNATVVAHVQLSESASSVGASALLNLRFRNWLLAWLEVYRTAAESTGDLGKELAGLLKRGASAGYVLESALGRVTGYIGREAGRVGQQVNRDIAEQALRDFMQTGIAELPTQARLSVRRGLTAATQTLGTREGPRLLASLGETRAALASNARVTEQGLSAQLDLASARLAEIVLGLSDLRTDMSGRLDGLRTDVTGELAVLRGDIGRQRTAMDAGIARLDGQIARKVDNSAFDDFRGNIERDLGGVVANVEALRIDRPIR